MQEELINKNESQTEQNSMEETTAQKENNEVAEEKNAILDDKNENLADKLAESEDKYLRLFAEFENFKRRTNKERIELFKTANQEVLIALLPVLDDFERSLKAMESATEISSIKEGIILVNNKLSNILQQKGLKPIDVAPGNDFNVDFHEAITSVPAPTEDMKGKIIDVVENGYMLNDKVIRFAKVIIGE
jgi:molecular chaperone GrpE